MNFKILSVTIETRCISVVYHLPDKVERSINLHMVGPTACQIDLDDPTAVKAYLTEFGETHYGKEAGPHPLTGIASG
jgi:hypothetical protein